MRPKDIQHADRPHKSVIPKSAMFLMANEDRGHEEDMDPADGGQVGDDSGMEGPDLVSQVRDLMAQYGPEQFQAAIEECMAEAGGQVDQVMPSGHETEEATEGI